MILTKRRVFKFWCFFFLQFNLINGGTTFTSRHCFDVNLKIRLEERDKNQEEESTKVELNLKRLKPIDI